MRRPIVWLWVGTAVFVSCLAIFPASSLAESPSPSPQIIISQIKITSANGQFITLYNNTDELVDLSAVQLLYFNNADLLKATSGKLISLSGKVPAHGYVLINDGSVQACYQMLVSSVSLGLSTTSGTLQIGHFPSASPPQQSVLDDYVSWSKTVPLNTQSQPVPTGDFWQRQPLDSQNAPVIDKIGGGYWISVSRPDGSTPCAVSAAMIAPGGQLLMAPASPPSITGASAVSSLSAIYIGQIAPQLSEILPNPAPPQSDSTDEYIEIYNPNSEPFDLSGFKLQSGIGTTHDYVFPDDDQSILLPNEFRAFYITQTGLTLTNDGGQVRFLDPSGNILAESDAYPAAKAGYAWIFANDTWQWTTAPTPNAVNVVNSPPAAKSLTTSSYTTAKPAAKKTTAKPAVKAAKTIGSPENAFAASPPAVASAGKIHPLTLVVVGSLALLYALYEYRHDLANTLHRLGRHRKAR